jgi:hypothetical protein
VALPIVLIGAVAISILAERFRMISRGERPARRAKRELSASAYLMIIGAIVATAFYVVFLVAVGGGR